MIIEHWAVEKAYLELAALIPTPSDAQLDDFVCITRNDNPADAVCLLAAYNWLRVALRKDEGEGI